MQPMIVACCSRRPAIRRGRNEGERSGTKLTLTFGHVADAAFVCSCSGPFLAAQRISPNQPFQASKLHNSKLPFRRTRIQQSGRGLSRPLLPRLLLTQHFFACATMSFSIAADFSAPAIRAARIGQSQSCHSLSSSPHNQAEGKLCLFLTWFW